MMLRVELVCLAIACYETKHISIPYVEIAVKLLGKYQANVKQFLMFP